MPLREPRRCIHLVPLSSRQVVGLTAVHSNELAGKEPMFSRDARSGGQPVELASLCSECHQASLDDGTLVDVDLLGERLSVNVGPDSQPFANEEHTWLDNKVPCCGASTWSGVDHTGSTVVPSPRVRRTSSCPAFHLCLDAEEEEEEEDGKVGSKRRTVDLVVLKKTPKGTPSCPLMRHVHPLPTAGGGTGFAHATLPDVVHCPTEHEQMLASLGLFDEDEVV